MSLVTTQGSFRQLWRLGIPGYRNYFNCESSQPTISQEDFRCAFPRILRAQCLSATSYIFVKIVLKEHCRYTYCLKKVQSDTWRKKECRDSHFRHCRCFDVLLSHIPNMLMYVNLIHVHVSTCEHDQFFAGLHSTLSLHSSPDCHVLFHAPDYLPRPAKAFRFAIRIRVIQSEPVEVVAIVSDLPHEL